MKKALVKLNENQVEKSKNFFLDLSVIPGMAHGHNAKISISEGTRDQRLIVGEQFNDWMAKNDLTLLAVTPEKINQFLNSEKWEPATKNAKRNHLIQLIKAQSDDIRFKLLVSENAKQIEKAKDLHKHITRDEYLTKGEIVKLISLTRKEKTRLIIEFLFQTGCRISEMINVTLKNVTLNGQAKISVIGKGSKHRHVYCKRELIERIIDVFGSTDYLFCTVARGQAGIKVKYNRVNIFRILRLAGDKAGFTTKDLDTGKTVSRIHPHIFRHSFVMHLKEQGKSPKYIQSLTGHANIATLIEFYFHEMAGEEVTELF